MLRIWSAIAFASLGVLAPVHVSAQVAAPPTKPAATATKKASATPPKADTGQLSDEAQLSRIAGLYESAKYRECSDEVESLLDPTSHRHLRQPGIVESARVYWAACLIGAGDADAADAPLRAAIHENPQMKAPDSLMFPQPLIERFLKVRDSLVNEIRAAEQARIQLAQEEARRRLETQAAERYRMRELEKLASKETVVFQNSRALALVPFGVGQFQNRERTLGYTLLVGEALFASLSVAAVIEQSRLTSEAAGIVQNGGAIDQDQQQRNMNTWRAVKVGGFWAFAALAVGGIVQAQLEFVPEFREERTRPLPPLKPTATPTPSQVSATPYFDRTGGGLSLTGRF